MITWLRDWWRGYSDADMASALAKVSDAQASGQCFALFEYREWMALEANDAGRTSELIKPVKTNERFREIPPLRSPADR